MMILSVGIGASGCGPTTYQPKSYSLPVALNSLTLAIKAASIKNREAVAANRRRRAYR